MTAKAAASSAKHAPATAKHAGTRKHTETAKQKAARHMASVKAAATRKANKAKVTAKGKPATHAKASKAAGFAVGDLLPVCSLEAIAMSLRLAGQPVSDDEVAWLWELCGSPEEGVSVGGALAAAALFGLAGCRPLDLYRAGHVEQAGELAAVGHVAVDDLLNDAVFDHFTDDLAVRGVRGRVAEYLHGVDTTQFQPLIDLAGRTGDVHGLILRIDVPGPHAVLATPDGWWSWGERHDPWPCRVSDAWAVSWS